MNNSVIPKKKENVHSDNTVVVTNFHTLNLVKSILFIGNRPFHGIYFSVNSLKEGKSYGVNR